MKAYLNDQALKEKTIAAMQADIAAERLVKGHYWSEDKGNGCFVGCVVRGNEHSKFEKKLGVPRLVAYVSDRIFEQLEYEDSKKFSVDLLAAINVGADLSKVMDRLAVSMLVDAAHGVIRFVKSDRVKAAITAVADMYTARIEGNEFSSAKREKIRAELRSADASADAYAYAYAYAYASAYAYAYAYSYADASAYASASASADAYADARKKYYVILATELIRLLCEAI